MRTKLTLLLLLSILCSCTNAQQIQKADFNFKVYASPDVLNTKKDSVIAFTNLMLDKKFSEAEKIYPEMFKIDVSVYMNEGPGYEPYLGYLGEFVIDYDNTYSNLALATFLEQKYNALDNVYDMLLRASLNMDPSNVAAMFLLAKLRYEHDITDDAYFLVQHMMKLEPENKKISQLHTWFKNNHAPLGNNLPSLKEFVEQEVYYRELD
ncbi:hypothetical protein [Pontibacter sp. BAB1700]|uniref:hypothetical protein n=1 Tax=Pontibacter sp. BAB1700 TaxID=1144253 RepID=UPI00026BCDC8|nr:hypothetical protein [Pontibacter sp. BAB1700]EJF10151.1 hypothetical protein O71_10974 [Pontibacter sp. BAB1700]